MSFARFYRHHAVDSCRNMAFDEWMLATALEHPGAVLVRVYTWEVGSITIGVNQTPERAIRLPQLGETPVVRRVTGGRALYHDQSELTYAVGAHPCHGEPVGWDGPKSEIYAFLARTIGNFLAVIGIDAQLVRRDRSGARPDGRDSVPPCFSSSARYELLSQDVKVVASAQRQVGRAFLQHGSIKLSGIAAHPALPGVVGAESNLQPLDPKRFGFLADQFKRTFETAAGRDLDDSSESWTGVGSLSRRVQQVRSAPLSRRDTFEQ
jgi:lipoate-protein ligase A